MHILPASAGMSILTAQAQVGPRQKAVVTLTQCLSPEQMEEAQDAGRVSLSVPA